MTMMIIDDWWLMIDDWWLMIDDTHGMAPIFYRTSKGCLAGKVLSVMFTTVDLY